MSLFYTTSAASGPPDTRLPLAEQRRAANDLLSRLPIGTATSKSHSRTAVAVCRGDCRALGIDLEFMSRNRDLARIAAHYVGEPPADLDAPAFYRAWTFGEAYLKAFGAIPSPEILRRVLQTERTDIWMVEGDIRALHRMAHEHFMLSLVWTGDAEPTYVRP